MPRRKTTKRSHTHALRVLKDVAEALNSATTEQRAASEALKRMADLLGVEAGWVWLRDPVTERFYSAAVQNLPPYLQEPVRMTGRSCWCLELFRTGQLTARNIDIVECSRLTPAVGARESAQTEGLRCHASVPLYAGARPLGVMNLAMRGGRRLTRGELDQLTTIADQLGVAIERARLGEQSIEHARADERARIARDIHDTLAQEFAAIGLHIEAGLSQLDGHEWRASAESVPLGQPQASKFTGAPSQLAGRESAEARHEAAKRSLGRALDAARQGLDEARRSIASLRESPLENRSLAEALAAHTRRFTGETGVRVRLELADVGPLSSPLEIELFRIAGEALANVGKHAHAREAGLRLERLRGRIRLTITDAGAGFSPRSARRRGFGLAVIEDRARLVGGRATIRSTPGRGTTVTVTVPVAERLKSVV